MEEKSAVLCAVENILVGAQALDIAKLGSTGGMRMHTALKNHFEMNEQNHILGILFLSKTSEQVAGHRKIALSEKVVWEY